jgi:hypothetical protein
MEGANPRPVAGVIELIVDDCSAQSRGWFSIVLLMTNHNSEKNRETYTGRNDRSSCLLELLHIPSHCVTRFRGIPPPDSEARHWS